MKRISLILIVTIALFAQPILAQRSFNNPSSLQLVEASVPELQKRTCSKDGAREAISSASSTSSSVGNETVVSKEACRLIASTVSKWQWPWISDV